jgi:hypothetical protein
MIAKVKNTLPNPPRVCANDANAKGAPVIPSLYNPAVIITNPVRVHITNVSTKTSNIPQKPCSAGSLHREAACAIGAEPKPASLVNTPLATPYLMARIIIYPPIPPPTVCTEKALRRITPKAGNIPEALTAKIQIVPTK